MKRRLLRILAIVLGSVLGLAVLAVIAGTVGVRGSLPRLAGRAHVAGLEEAVRIDRDDLGVPFIQAANRPDAARALGYLHAQDRFFQMDLQRRLAAGELAALMGPALLETDRDHRRHGFQDLARQVVAAASPSDRALLKAYAAGVNAGLADLRARPFEYWLLRQKPAAWRPEDTVLSLYAMAIDLSLSGAVEERDRVVVRELLPAGAQALLFPRGNRWEAPLQDDPVSGVVIPDSAAFDLRRWKFSGMTWQAFHDSVRQAADAAADPSGGDAADQVPPHDRAGSNNWAVAGRLTAHGGALIASDMHLALSLPNTWYRVRMAWPEDDAVRDLVGVTLPGTPLLVAGSNGQVAWCYTNSQSDTADLVIVETDSTDASRYLTPDGPRPFDRRREVIAVAGAAPDTLWAEWTIWGPVWKTDYKGRKLALRWTAHDATSSNLALQRLETVATIDEALDVAAVAGIPQQNFVCADADGRIGWTIIGAIPRREGWDGRAPSSWSDGAHRWTGYATPDERPRIVDPPEGRLWTANNRVVGGADLDLLGEGGYATGPRARQIRDALRALDHPDEEDMLALQLDDRAVFVQEWRDLALQVLERHPPAPGSPRDVWRRTVTERWEGRAVPSSVSYYMARNVMWGCVDGVFEVLLRPLRARDPQFHDWSLPYRLAVTWELLEQQPPHLLAPWHVDWDDVVLQAIDRVMAQAGDHPETFTWATHHETVIAHPFTQILPQLSRWLALPPAHLPGDGMMPRVQGGRSGASNRMVVSPGREQDGIFHMPGGQSGHPFSPYFTKGHTDWMEGNPTPLLPGPAVHTLVLEGR
ncbi:penicillin acylase family protein [bacterium]|nr:penicillin acylase family protein [bacterium]